VSCFRFLGAKGIIRVNISLQLSSTKPIPFKNEIEILTYVNIGKKRYYQRSKTQLQSKVNNFNKLIKWLQYYYMTNEQF
jgi:hypothetical protein